MKMCLDIWKMHAPKNVESKKEYFFFFESKKADIFLLARPLKTLNQRRIKAWEKN